MDVLYFTLPLVYCHISAEPLFILYLLSNKAVLFLWWYCGEVSADDIISGSLLTGILASLSIITRLS